MKLLKPIKKLFFVFSLCLLVSNCNSNGRSELIYLYSKNKLQAITILSDYGNNERIIALGKVRNRPKTDYIKLDISEVTELGDEIGVCWLENGWQLVNDKSKIIEIHLDTAKYVVKTSWYEDADGVPNAAFYRNANCYTVGTLGYSKIHPNSNGYIVRE